MAAVCWILFAVFLASCGAQFPGYNRRLSQSRAQSGVHINKSTRSEHPTALSPDPYSNVKDNRCHTLTRRPFYMVKVLSYPCSRRFNGVPVLRVIPGHNGPMCLSYFRVPVYQYYRVETCCPGWTFDNYGRCTVRAVRPSPPQTQQARPSGPSMSRVGMMAMAARMRAAMWRRAQEGMAAHKTMLARRLNQIRSREEPERVPMSPISYVLRRLRNKMRRGDQSEGPKIAFIRFRQPQAPSRKPSTPPMPHPLQRPPMMGNMMSAFRTRMSPPVTRFPSFPPNFHRAQTARKFPQIPPRAILSGMFSRNSIAMPRSMHQMSPFNRGPQAPRMPMGMQVQRPFPQIPRPSLLPAQHYQQPPFPQTSPEKSFPAIPDTFPEEEVATTPGTPLQEETQMTDTSFQLSAELPGSPIQMPDPYVEEGPLNTDSGLLPEEDNGTACRDLLETAIKDCLAEHNLNLPDIMSAFEPTNEESAQTLCSRGQAISDCMSAGLQECQDGPDAETARAILAETMQTVESMCAMRIDEVPETDPQEAALEEELTTDPEVAEILTDAQTQTDTDSKPLDTVAKLDAAPTEIAAKEDAPVVNDKEKAPAAMRHEVHVKEVESQDFYLPLLVGAGVGFVVLVLIISLFICCCYKRQMKKKMKIAKESQRPSALDGIYTIGVPPPVYEVKGIPPVFYEEAKGETISAKDEPATIPVTGEAGENTQM